ncbi:hypothetical protein ACFWZ6_05770 [Streptomyces massasporeus]
MSPRAPPAPTEEDPAVGATLGVLLQVITDVRDDRKQLRNGPADPHGAVVQVDAPAVQADQLTPALR